MPAQQRHCRQRPTYMGNSLGRMVTSRTPWWSWWGLNSTSGSSCLWPCCEGGQWGSWWTGFSLPPEVTRVFLWGWTLFTPMNQRCIQNMRQLHYQRCWEDTLHVIFPCIAPSLNPWMEPAMRVWWERKCLLERLTDWVISGCKEWLI